MSDPVKPHEPDATGCVPSLQPTPLTLGHGQFFGRGETRREAGGFSIAVLRPQLRADEVEQHTHEVAHFVLVIEGVYLTAAAGASGGSGPMTLVYNPPGTTHRDRFHTDDGLFLAVSIDPAVLSAIEEVVTLPRRATAYLSPRLTVRSHAIAAAAAAPYPSSAFSLETLCSYLLVSLGSHAPEPRLEPPWLRRASELLHDRCGDSLRLAEVARESGVHPVHFARAFRRFRGCSPGAFLRQCRIERAAALIRDTPMPLAEIALHSGFADQSHLSHIFRSACGASPGRYRRLVGRWRDVQVIQDGTGQPASR